MDEVRRECWRTVGRRGDDDDGWDWKWVIRHCVNSISLYEALTSLCCCASTHTRTHTRSRWHLISVTAEQMASRCPHRLVKNNGTPLKVPPSLSLALLLSLEHFSGNYQGGRPPAVRRWMSLAAVRWPPPTITLAATCACWYLPLMWPPDCKLAQETDREGWKENLNKRTHHLGRG